MWRVFVPDSPDPGTAWQPGWILRPGQTLLETYRIRRMVGKPGGMGQVFLADDLRLGMDVAIKVPALSILHAPRGPSRFLREARIAARLGPHAHIVQIRACLTDPALTLSVEETRESVSIPFIVMEFLGGGDLSDRIRAGPLPSDTAVGFACDIGAALQAAHCFEYREQGRVIRGIVHRDVKPQNVCFDERGRLVVVDFGLARILEDPSSTGGLGGTPYYMAPEQWRPDQTVDHLVDVYALGVVLYEMLTGVPPFAGTLAEIRQAHLTVPPPDPRRVVPGISAAVADAIRRAMAKDRRDRPGTVEELCRDLRTALAVQCDPAGHRRAGDGLARRELFDAAMREYDEALRLDPLEPLARINRGYCLYRKGELKAAIAEYDVAVRVDPSSAEARNNRGMAWLDLGELDRAEADFRKAIELDPGHPLAANNLRIVQARRRS